MEEKENSSEIESSSSQFSFLLDHTIAHIFIHISFSEALRIRNVSKLFREYTVKTLLKGYEQAYERIQKVIILAENELKEMQVELESHGKPIQVGEYLRKHKQCTSLRTIYGLLKLVRAVVHRYVQARVWNFISSYSGQLLDEFDSAFKLAINLDTSQSKFIADDFFTATERFLQHFLNEVEPKLIPLLPAPYPFGLQVIDIFDAAQFTNFTATFKRLPSDKFYRYEGSYQLRDLAVVHYPPIDTVDSNEKKLDLIRYSIISTVQSLNYSYPHRQHMLLVDSYSIHGIRGMFSNIDRNLHYHTGLFDEKDSCDSHHLCKHWIRQSNNCFTSDRFYKARSRVRQTLKLQIDSAMTCNSLVGVPLDFQALFNSQLKRQSVTDFDETEESPEQSQFYNFHCTLDIHHICPQEFIIFRRKININSEQNVHEITITDPLAIM